VFYQIKMQQQIPSANCTLREVGAGSAQRVQRRAGTLHEKQAVRCDLHASCAYRRLWVATPAPENCARRGNSAYTGHAGVPRTSLACGNPYGKSRLLICRSPNVGFG